jgi:UDP-N-acetyl-D-mannosaminuronic acid dehydrogenase
MRAVTSAAEMIVPHLQPGNLVILESTSPPRTTIDLIQPILETSGMQVGTDILLAYSPERVLPGRILDELKHNSRVIGGINPESTQAGYELYAHFVRGEIVLTDATTAEMVKLMENTYRDVNIAIANEFSRLADHFGIDVWEAITIANKHPRVNILNPGPGVGGHCISVDPWFLVEAAPDLTDLIRAARVVNDAQPEYVARLILREMKKIGGQRAAVLGLAYKPDVDDLRESPAIKIAELLRDSGISVTSYEPYKPEAHIDGIYSAKNLDSVVRDADCIIFLAAHSAFASLNPKEIAAITSARSVIDAVNVCDLAAWRDTGFEMVKVGVSKFRT